MTAQRAEIGRDDAAKRKYKGNLGNDGTFPGPNALLSHVRLANMPSMGDTINIHEAKTRLSQLVARAERGERITIARGGKPVAELGPIAQKKRAALPPDDPLLDLDAFAVEGAGGKLTNEEIDRTVYAEK
jgi:prevent-host-death family protein